MKRLLCTVPLLLTLTSPAALADAVPVTLTPEGKLLREGKPFFVRGIGGESRLDEAAARGANALRTWSTDQLTETLEAAGKRGMVVFAGMWLEPECAWFSYQNPEHCRKQEARVVEQVEKYKSQPALLAWGIGNESECDGKNASYWKQINRLAGAVKKADPNHITFTAVAGLSPEKAAGLNEHTPLLDFAGINTYGGIFSLREHLQKVKWTRPWAVTEFGPQGFWESPRSKWGAPLEQTSTQKAGMLRRAWTEVMKEEGGCIGGHVFLWGHKQEATDTWFSLFTSEGLAVAGVDVLEEMWTGKAPQNHAPVIEPLARQGMEDAVRAGTVVSVSATASDPDGDSLTYTWRVTPEKGPRDKEGRELRLEPVVCEIQGAGTRQVRVTLPARAGEWRIHVQAADGKGHAATANIPVKTE